MSLFEEALKDPDFRKLYEEEQQTLSYELLIDAEKRGMDRARRMVKEKAAYYFRAVEGHIEPTKSRGIFAHNCMLAMSVEISKAAKEIK